MEHQYIPDLEDLEKLISIVNRLKHPDNLKGILRAIEE